MKTKSLPVIRAVVPGVDRSPDVDTLLAANAPVAIGISGGKDSDAVAVAVDKHLNAIGHNGPRVLIHSDLGAIEWAMSGRQCEWLSQRLGMELIVVHRERGGMLERWEQRWTDNLQRYINLSCVQVILPWSTPGMRFCTSELKTDIICRALSKRFPGQQIVSVTGIRRQESKDRANAPISKIENKLTNKTRKTSGLTWNAIANWTIDEVWELHDRHGIPRHEAYTVYGASRVSCVACIMSAHDDLIAATRDARNHPALQRIGLLEIVSGFGFQGNRWLCDVLLAQGLRLKGITAKRVAEAKASAVLRNQFESCIPSHMLFKKGWPEAIPSRREASVLADVRKRMGDLLKIDVKFTMPAAVIRRYKELMAEKLKKET